MRIIAHRGMSARAPENTRAALRGAMRCGADGAEIDIRLTRDGEIVLLHDETVDRTSNITGRVADLTWQTLARADAGSWFDPAFAGEGVPRLADVLGEWPAGRRLFIELKVGTPLLAPLAAVLERHRGKDLILLGFDPDLMAAAVKAVPGWPVHVDLEAPPEAEDRWLSQQICRAGAAGWGGLSFGVAAGWQSHWPRVLHEAGLECAAWTVDDIAVARRLRDDGVDALMTNDPACLLRGLA